MVPVVAAVVAVVRRSRGCLVKERFTHDAIIVWPGKSSGEKRDRDGSGVEK